MGVVRVTSCLEANGGLTVGKLTGDKAPVITARTMPTDQGGSNERTELILFHGNDGTNGSGPDTITLRAPTIRLQTFDDSGVSDIEDNAGSKDRLVIDPAGAITASGLVTASGGLTVASGTLTAGAIKASGLDIAKVTRPGTHPTDNCVYITGGFGSDSGGVEIRHTNGSQGIGFGYNTIYATGNTDNQYLGLKARGKGVVRVTSCLEVGGNPTILLNHSGVRANQLRYNDGTLYLEAVTNGWDTTTTPNLTVGGRVTAGAINGCVTAPFVITGTGQTTTTATISPS